MSSIIMREIVANLEFSSPSQAMNQIWRCTRIFSDNVSKICLFSNLPTKFLKDMPTKLRVLKKREREKRRKEKRKKEKKRYHKTGER